MIYTTYFANLKNLPDNIIPVSIAGKSPEWYHGLEYKKLAPKYSFWKVWKENQDNQYYIDHYYSDVLSGLTQMEVIKELTILLQAKVNRVLHHPLDSNLNQYHIALVCYESPEKFCHRHLVSEWLEKDNFKCSELTKEQVGNYQNDKYRL